MRRLRGGGMGVHFRHVVTAGLLVSAGMLGGCFNYRVNHDARPAPTPVPASAWPERDASVLEGLAEATPREIYALVRVEKADSGARPESSGATEDEASTNGSGGSHGSSVEMDESSESGETPAYVVTDKRLVAGGLLRVYESGRERGGFESYLESLFYGFERNASFVSGHWFERFGAWEIERERADAEAFEARMNTRPEESRYRLSRPTASELLLDEGTIALGLPEEAAGDRGILIHLPALMGNAYEQRVVEGFERDGWTVIHVEADARIRGPGFEARREAIEKRERRRAELMEADPDLPPFRGKVSQGRAGWMLDLDMSEEDRRKYEEIYERATAQAADEIPMPDTGFEVRAGDDLRARAEVIATAVNEHLADHAYAAEAGVAYVDEAIPVLRDAPIVVMGFSAGSLAAPTVAAWLRERHPGRVGAMILIGSGAPVMDVARLSRLTDGGLNLTPEDGPTPDEATIDELRGHYLERASLDAWNVAASLTDIPVLHVYGKNDKIVPASTAETLNERLGGPDRLVYSGGHLGLFFFLPGQRARMKLWLDRALEE